jgi:hypothetical protein
VCYRKYHNGPAQYFNVSDVNWPILLVFSWVCKYTFSTKPATCTPRKRISSTWKKKNIFEGSTFFTWKGRTPWALDCWTLARYIQIYILIITIKFFLIAKNEIRSYRFVIFLFKKRHINFEIQCGKILHLKVKNFPPSTERKINHITTFTFIIDRTVILEIREVYIELSSSGLPSSHQKW